MLTPEQFGAIGDGKADDYLAMQVWADLLCTTHGIGYLKNKYRITKPVVFANWVGTKYAQISITIKGDATMSDNHAKSQVYATFKDAPVFSFQLAKGGGIYGVGLHSGWIPPKLTKKELYKLSLGEYSDSGCRNTRFSPACGIAIDPFSGLIPSDGGYPTLTEWYRGPQQRAGSTGFEVKHVTLNNCLIGLITSPNGYTQNAENILYEDIRFANCKIGMAGCQAQEKNNILRRFQCWGTTHTVIVFNKYGAGQPGNWWISNGNLAGTTVCLIDRVSSGWGKMSITDTFAESIYNIGYWYGGSGDTLSNCLLNMEYTENLGYMPPATMTGQRVHIKDCQIRYYGRQNQPLLFPGHYNSGGNQFDIPPIFKLYEWTAIDEGYSIIKYPFVYTSDVVENNTYIATFKVPNPSIVVGDHVVFMNHGDWRFIGQGKITAIEGDKATISYISPNMVNLERMNIGVYKKK